MRTGHACACVPHVSKVPVRPPSVACPGCRHNYANKNYVEAAQHLAALQVGPAHGSRGPGGGAPRRRGPRARCHRHSATCARCVARPGVVFRPPRCGWLGLHGPPGICLRGVDKLERLRESCMRRPALTFHAGCQPTPPLATGPPLPPLLQKKGKVKHVGATNFDVLRLQEFVAAGVTIVNNQVGALQGRCARPAATAGEAGWCAELAGSRSPSPRPFPPSHTHRRARTHTHTHTRARARTTTTIYLPQPPARSALGPERITFPHRSLSRQLPLLMLLQTPSGVARAHQSPRAPLLAPPATLACPRCFPAGPVQSAGQAARERHGRVLRTGGHQAAAVRRAGRRLPDGQVPGGQPQAVSARPSPAAVAQPAPPMPVFAGRRRRARAVPSSD